MTRCRQRGSALPPGREGRRKRQCARIGWTQLETTLYNRNMNDDEYQRYRGLIVNLASQGKTPREIAELSGCPPRGLAMWMRRNGISYQRDPGKPSASSACARNHDLVVKMATEGATIHEIANLVGTNLYRVRQYLTRHDIRRPEWRERLPGSSPMSRRVEGRLNGAWKGERTVEKGGYISIWVDGRGRIAEHRYMMEQMIGRRLTQEEVVHHKDKNTGNNHPDNLQLFPSNAEHLRFELTGVPCPARANRYDANGNLTRTGGQRSPGTISHPEE